MKVRAREVVRNRGGKTSPQNSNMHTQSASLLLNPGPSSTPNLLLPTLLLVVSLTHHLEYCPPSHSPNSNACAARSPSGGSHDSAASEHWRWWSRTMRVVTRLDPDLYFVSLSATDTAIARRYASAAHAGRFDKWNAWPRRKRTYQASRLCPEGRVENENVAA